jgi:hypothetical protein
MGLWKHRDETPANKKIAKFLIDKYETTACKMPFFTTSIDGVALCLV